jgi:hypothetical protein
MIRTILIDCEMRKYCQHGTGFEGYIRPASFTVDFTATLYVGGRPSLRKIFHADFREQDLDDEERLAQVIIADLMQNRRPPDIWDNPNPPEQIGDELHIEFSETARQVFEFLKKYSQKLIEAFKI